MASTQEPHFVFEISHESRFCEMPQLLCSISVCDVILDWIIV